MRCCAIPATYKSDRGREEACYLLTVDAAINIMTGDDVLRLCLQLAGKEIAKVETKVEPRIPPPLSDEQRLKVALGAEGLLNRMGTLDDRIRLELSDYATRIIIPTKQTSTLPALWSVMEFLNSKGKRPDAGERTIIGRQMAQVWRLEMSSEPKTSMQLVNGAMRPVKIYPADWLEEKYESSPNLFVRNQFLN